MSREALNNILFALGVFDFSKNKLTITTLSPLYQCWGGLFG
jgi:hypothetical protein